MGILISKKKTMHSITDIILHTRVIQAYSICRSLIKHDTVSKQSEHLPMTIQ